MATQKLFMIYDSKAETHTYAFHAPTAGLAMRSFQEQCQNPDTVYYKFPTDFTLFECAETDFKSGNTTDHPQNINLGMAADFMTEHLDGEN